MLLRYSLKDQIANRRKPVFGDFLTQNLLNLDLLPSRFAVRRSPPGARGCPVKPATIHHV